jgi:hypothetical protein
METGTTRLGFTLLLKFFELEGHPRHAGEVPQAAVDYVAQQVGMQPDEFGRYDWSGRQVKRHRAQVCDTLGFREPTLEDEDRLTQCLATEVGPTELGEERQREALLAAAASGSSRRAPSRLDRVLAAARAAAEQHFFAQTVGRLQAKAVDRLEELAAGELKSTRGRSAWRPCSPRLTS